MDDKTKITLSAVVAVSAASALYDRTCLLGGILGDWQLASNMLSCAAKRAKEAGDFETAFRCGDRAAQAECYAQGILRGWGLGVFDRPVPFRPYHEIRATVALNSDW